MKTARKDFQFFLTRAGYCVGQRALGAIDLARAEVYATDREWTVEWEHDDDPELGDHAYWCSDAKRDKCRGHEVLCAVLKDRRGTVLASLGSVIDPDRTFARVVEAELALEAWCNERERALVQCLIHGHERTGARCVHCGLRVKPRTDLRAGA